jgi:hypothetical protein
VLSKCRIHRIVEGLLRADPGPIGCHLLHGTQTANQDLTLVKLVEHISNMAKHQHIPLHNDGSIPGQISTTTSEPFSQQEVSIPPFPTLPKLARVAEKIIEKGAESLFEDRAFFQWAAVETIYRHVRVEFS